LQSIVAINDSLDLACLAFVLLQYTPARPQNLIFQSTCGRPQISLSKVAGCAPLRLTNDL